MRARILAGDEPAWLRRHPRRAYIVQLNLATPPWANTQEIARLNKRARELTQATGVPHVVDHDIPITNKRVCGLNTPANLRIITAAANARKLNHWCEWHGELFGEPEQFSLDLSNCAVGYPAGVEGSAEPQETERLGVNGKPLETRRSRAYRSPYSGASLPLQMHEVSTASDLAQIADASAQSSEMLLRLSPLQR